MTYVPVSLEAYCNAGVDVLGDAAAPPLGEQLFHGLPFRVGGDPARCFVSPALGSAVEIRLDADARYVVLAHRLLEPAEVGAIVAEYVFGYDDDSVTVPIRARFEIAVVPDAAAIAASPPSGGRGQLPFDARSDRPVGLHPRDAGPWGSAGRRQADVSSADVVPRGYFLWTWENPSPGRRLSTLIVRPRDRAFAIAAVTLSDGDEYPFVCAGARPVKVVVKTSGALPEISVDRGVAAFTQRACDPATMKYGSSRWKPYLVLVATSTTNCAAATTPTQPDKRAVDDGGCTRCSARVTSNSLTAFHASPPPFGALSSIGRLDARERM
jgi:hypothetical protein